jgi:hypothetical protein
MTAHRRDVGAELVAALMWGPKTVPQLVEHVGAKERNVRQWLDIFRRSGVVYVFGEAPPSGRGGRPACLYAMQSTPFHFDDVEIAA